VEEEEEVADFLVLVPFLPFFWAVPAHNHPIREVLDVLFVAVLAVFAPFPPRRFPCFFSVLAWVSVWG
jgi:hypothetical protein